ncbi:hypothetical protein BOO35_19035 [Vibrio navarrensis]|uniref:SHOCT domain-containing protein n=1 Tax=Vibrio navarrensis TaxID=29495 RepID=UPI0018668FF3|nr:SHOCT domain-containing protein [Vibrio navarrensis]MBE3667159.1 hypothetical protein [Vibrio navarrensis]MBE4602013.1 hypothetical protein [Vibrio navarrensis]
MENDILVKTYKGSEATAIVASERDAIFLKTQGYYPIAQSYQQGQWGIGAFIFALILCVILIGVIALIYMVIVKPDGTLTVRYKVINKVELNEFISLYVENEDLCRKERKLRKMFENVSNNNLNITNEDIVRAIAKIESLIKEKSVIKATEQANSFIPESQSDEIVIRIRKLQALLDEGLIEENEFIEKRKEILASL